MNCFLSLKRAASKSMILHARNRADSQHWSFWIVHRSDAWINEDTPPFTRAETMKRRSLNSNASDILCDTRSLRRRPRSENVTCAQQVPSVFPLIRFRTYGCVPEGERYFRPVRSLSLPDVRSIISKATADGVCTYLVKRRCATWRRNALCYLNFEVIANHLLSKHSLAFCGMPRLLSGTVNEFIEWKRRLEQAVVQTREDEAE